MNIKNVASQCLYDGKKFRNAWQGLRRLLARTLESRAPVAFPIVCLTVADQGVCGISDTQKDVKDT